MTLTQYMDPDRFPLTTWTGLTAREQFVEDAVRLGRLREYLGTGVTPTEEQSLRLAELEEKAAARPFLIDEAEAAGRGLRMVVARQVRPVEDFRGGAALWFAPAATGAYANAVALADRATAIRAAEVFDAPGRLVIQPTAQAAPDRDGPPHFIAE